MAYCRVISRPMLSSTQKMEITLDQFVREATDNGLVSAEEIAAARVHRTMDRMVALKVLSSKVVDSHPNL